MTTTAARRPALGFIAALGALGALAGAPACEEAKRDPPTFTPTSGTTNPTTNATGSGSSTGSGNGGGGSGGAMASGSTSSASGSTSSASSSASGSTGTSTGSVCMSMDCVPACNGFQMCIEVTPCDFQCTQGAIGDPCATMMDCVASLQCVNNKCI